MPVMIVRDQRLVDRQVDHLAQRHALVLAQVLAEPVEHHDRVVHRIADDGQDRGHRLQVELDSRRSRSDQAEGQDRRRGTGPPPRPGRTAARTGTRCRSASGQASRGRGQQALAQQLAGDLRADHVGAQRSVTWPERAWRSAPLTLVAVALGSAPRRRLEAHHGVVVGAEPLHLDIAEVADRSARRAPCRGRPRWARCEISSTVPPLKSMPQVEPPGRLERIADRPASRSPPGSTGWRTAAPASTNRKCVGLGRTLIRGQNQSRAPQAIGRVFGRAARNHQPRSTWVTGRRRTRVVSTPIEQGPGEALHRAGAEVEHDHRRHHVWSCWRR